MTYLVNSAHPIKCETDASWIITHDNWEKLHTLAQQPYSYWQLEANSRVFTAYFQVGAYSTLPKVQDVIVELAHPAQAFAIITDRERSSYMSLSRVLVAVGDQLTPITEEKYKFYYNLFRT